MLKRLWLILGPVFCAGLLVLALLLFYPIQYHKHNFAEEKRSAVTLTAESFKSRSRKIRALSDKDHHFVPFFGSSEWLRFDSLHPSVLAEKYQRSYTPYLLGQRGAASLTQYFGMQQITPYLKHQSAVYVISPQWFTARGADPAAFQQYFSSDQLTSFLQQKQGGKAAQYAAKRLLDIYPNISMAALVKKTAKQQQFSSFERHYLDVCAHINQREEALFSDLTAYDNDHYEQKVKSKLGHLPAVFSYSSLGKLADSEAEKYTNNNHLGIDNQFYNHRLKKKITKLKGAQKKISYVQSPEYNDLQLVLHQFAASQTNVLFVIPPVNERWMKYTGLNKEMYQKTVAKIKYQLTSQGFSNIADFSKDGGEQYFMQDTIHIGWNGWLAFDRYAQPFLENPQPAPDYQLNDQFFSKKWADYTGDVKDFQ